ncbi:MAG: pyridoxal phosphate-dependent aminotransferase [Desulfovibrionales bacterium]
MQLSHRVLSVKPSATLTINTKAQEMRAQGKEVVSLAVGEPDFPTPEHVVQAAKDALDAGFTRYTAVPGIPELRMAVAGYFTKFYDIAARPEQTIVTNGGKQGLYNIFQAMLNPGDEVLLPSPYWVSYPAMIQLAGGKTVQVPTQPENDFLVRVEDLDRSRTERTTMLLLNTPSNPTGCHYSRRQLDEIVSWALDAGLFILSDEIYDRLVYAPAEPASLAHWFERHPDRVAIVNGLAKSFAMTGWRVGYVLAHEDLVKGLSKLQGQSTSNICSIAQKGALAALTGSWDMVDEMKKSFVRRRDLALERVSSWEGVVCPKPDGAFYLFPQVSGSYTQEIKDSTTLCTHILETAGVALVPGAAFGDDRCIRISYALDDGTLLRALDKIGDVLMKLRA